MKNKIKMVDFQTLFAQPSITKFNSFSQGVFQKLATCHTAKMGFHRLVCNDKNCGKTHYQYHSCGNRHCPNCGSLKREEWIENRLDELLPTTYYHLVFTLPHELNPLIMGNRKALFKLLFDAASQTIMNHSRMKNYLGADCGITMILHTWGQDLSFHPHVHCIVTGGGFDGQKWIAAKRKKDNFLFPEASLSKMYRAIFLKNIATIPLEKAGFDLEKTINDLEKKRWNVFAKAPFGGPAQVVEYLGRYSHKIAITKHRIIAMTDADISFRYKDYADGGKTKTMKLSHDEFLRRFEQHILPKRFVKIRHYGFLQNQGKKERLAKIRASLNLGKQPEKVTIPLAIKMIEKFGVDIFKCKSCATGRLVLVQSVRFFKTQTQEYQEIQEITAKNKASPVAWE
jgi:hypothetical protein